MIKMKMNSLFTICTFLMLFGSMFLTAEAQQTVKDDIPKDIKKLGLLPIAHLDSTKTLSLTVGLTLQNRDALANLLQELYDPTSINFHKWLSPAQFTAQFGPTEQEYQSVLNFFIANGFIVTKTYSDRMLVDVSGSVRDIEKTFHLNLMVYNHPLKAGIFYAPDLEPSLNLLTPIAHISGLSNYAIAVTHIKVTSASRTNSVPMNGTGSIGGAYGSADFRAAYAPGVTLTGSGQVTASLQLDGYSTSDITHYESDNGLPNVPLQNVLIDSASGNPSGNGGEVETTLDIEMQMAMAPGLSKIMVYEAPTTGDLYQHFDHILSQMATDNSSKQISCSWGINPDESDQTADNSFIQMAAQGQAFFCASGDEDGIINSTWTSGNENVNSFFSFPCDDPNITQVGGTTLTTSGPAGSYVSETVWNTNTYQGYPRYAYVGSSGGVSQLYSIPSWQTSVNMSNNQGSTTMRNVPDVALIADGIYEYVDGQPIYNQGGTSCAAPLWSGFIALANQQSVSSGGGPLGFINPIIYTLSRGSQYSSDIHDITSGNNSWPGSSGKFSATSGFDLCTGWGSPKGQSLINDLTEAQLYYYAYQNESTNYDATGDNHNRSLAKGNNLYEAFSSGGEIFVRQSSNNGFSWNYTTRISTGNGNNSVPSIVVYPVSGTTDTVNVVWERSLGSNYYDIYYSMSGNSGASWSSPILLENSVLVSSYQYGGPQPVICGIASTPNNPPYSPIQPMLPASYMHGILVVYTSNNGLYYTYEYNYPGWGWSAPASITTSAPGSYIWYPSLASSGGNVSPYANLSYDARYYHKIYSNYFTASSNTWSTEAVVYDGSNQMSYDRQSCIAAGGAYIFDAWNSYNSTYGYYTVKFRQGNYPNSWQSWEWTYPGTTANYFFPSISAYYNGSEYVAITDYTSPGNQILLHKGNMSTFTWQTYTVGSNALFPNLPNSNNDDGNSAPLEVWTGTAVGSAYPLSISSQDLPKENSTDASSKITIYQRAISSGDVRVELDGVSATTNQGQDINIPLKSFDYTKNADMSDPWQYLQTEDSTAIAGVSNVTLNLSVTTSNNAKADSIQLLAQKAANVVTPTELDIYNGGELIYTRTLSGKDAILNRKIEFPIPGGTLLGLKPVIKFSAQGDQSAVVKFSTIENTISTAPSLSQQLAANTVTPTSFNLHQNYPNPFNPSTIISYDIPKSGFVTLKVYDLLGRKITTLYNGNQKAGTYNVSFDASRLSSGVYFYQLRAGDFVSIKKMVLLK